MRPRLAFFAPLLAGVILLTTAVPADAAVNNVVAGPGALFTTFLTPVVVTTQGGSVTFSNYDVFPHDVTHHPAADGCTQNCLPRFSSGPAIGFGKSANVAGVADLEPGTYSFWCDFHQSMPGKLVVVPSPEQGEE